MRTFIHTQGRHGFSLVEVLVSASLIVVLLVGVYRINSFLSENNTSIIRGAIIEKYGQYITSAIRSFYPGNTQSTYFLTLSGSTLSYSTNFLYQNSSAGFFVPEDSRISQRIDYIGSGSIHGVVFDTYKITIADTLTGISKIYSVTR
ncbi:MAG: prepilin-type N-terminal cleavage/methylation domain-containing protein [Candidatus Gracilibacteria bacterium]|nr:prepilin-type N-terminal cleavage/methylation domain-containing protein [Candidatus Gracilibacteria bacterium]